MERCPSDSQASRLVANFARRGSAARALAWQGKLFQIPGSKLCAAPRRYAHGSSTTTVREGCPVAFSNRLHQHARQSTEPSGTDTFAVGICGGRGGDAPPVFLKLHKVGSTTAAGFFECAQRRGVFPERCGRADARLKGAFPPWRHGTARAYALHGPAPFRDADCSKLFVMLRDPADRTLSLISYFFRPPFVRNPTLLAKARALLQDPAASTPAAFAEMLDAYDARFTDQTKGTGLREYEDVLGTGPPEDALAPFVVGLTEAMNVSLALFAAALGWPPEAACLLPTARARETPRGRAIPSWLRRAVEARAPRDAALYAAAVTRHERQVAEYGAAAPGPAALRTCNAARAAVLRESPDLAQALAQPTFKDSVASKFCHALAQHSGGFLRKKM